MRVVTSLEFGGARILQEFWMTLLKVLSRNKKKEPNEQGRQSRTANNKRDHLLMKKHLRHKRFQPFLPVRSPCLLSHSLLIFFCSFSFFLIDCNFEIKVWHLNSLELIIIFFKR